MPNRILPPNDVLKEMYESPMSSREIADALGANLHTVHSALTRVPGLVMRSQSEAQKLAFARGKKPARFWLGKKQPPEMVEKRVSKIRGERHYLWSGGKSRREYRNKVKKEKCSSCGARTNLCIHHVNYDHYDNAPENLHVFCVSCHLGLHKTAYWAALRNGTTPPRSTAPSHWKKGGDTQ